MTEKSFAWNVSHGNRKAVVKANTQIGAKKAAARLWGYKRTFPMETIQATIKRK